MNPQQESPLVEQTQSNSNLVISNSVKQNNTIVIILSILLLISISVSGYFAYQTHKLTNMLLNTKNDVKDSLLPRETAVLSSVASFTNKYDFGSNVYKIFSNLDTDGSKISINNRSRVWWISPDGYNIINDNEIGLEYSNYKMCEEDGRIANNFDTIVTLASDGIKLVMSSFGFNLNSLNSSDSITDAKFYDYVQGYEKEAVKCTLTTINECSTSSAEEPMSKKIIFTCTNKYKENYNEQLPYLNDLNINDAIIHIAETTNNFARINVNYRRSGHYMIIKLINNKWTQLYSGQDIPSCKIMKTNEVPREIYGNCFD